MNGSHSPLVTTTTGDVYVKQSATKRLRMIVVSLLSKIGEPTELILIRSWAHGQRNKTPSKRCDNFKPLAFLLAKSAPCAISLSATSSSPHDNGSWKSKTSSWGVISSTVFLLSLVTRRSIMLQPLF